MKYNLTQFQKDLAYFDLTLTDRQIEQFMMYYEMLVETNKVMNLTAITEFDEVLQKHFVQLLHPFSWLVPSSLLVSLPPFSSFPAFSPAFRSLCLKFPGDILIS